MFRALSTLRLFPQHTKKKWNTSIIVSLERGVDEPIEADTITEAISKTLEMYRNGSLSLDGKEHISNVSIAVQSPSGNWIKYVVE